MKSNYNKYLITTSIKLFVITLIFLNWYKSTPLITVYSSNQRIIKETIDDFDQSVKSLKMKNLILTNYTFLNINKTIDQSNITGTLFNFNCEDPSFLKFEFLGKINKTNIFLSNEGKEKIMQLDLNFNYSLLYNDIRVNNSANIRLISKILNFTKYFDNTLDFYGMTPELNITLAIFDLQVADEGRKELGKFILEAIKNEENLKKIMEEITVYISESVEKNFRENIKEFYQINLKKKTNIFFFSLTPEINPEITDNSQSLRFGQQYFLEGLVLDKNLEKISDLNYTNTKLQIFRHFDESILSEKIIFINFKIFADLIKIDLINNGFITVYEDKVDLNLIPFRFNVLYLNNFIPGLNRFYSNSQKFFIQICINDVVYEFADDYSIADPKEKSYVKIYSDLYFRTEGVSFLLVNLKLVTKVYLDVERPLDSNKFNIKFEENIKILECLPLIFVGYYFDVEKFIEEFEKSYSVTFLGNFDYRLFAQPILLKDIINENHEIRNHPKGLVFYENDQKFYGRKLKFLEQK